MSTDIKPGQVWAATADPEETQRVVEVRDGHVWSENRYGGHIVLSAAFFPNGRHLVTDATPAPLDPSKVKVGDTVTLVGTLARVEGPVSDIHHSPSGRRIFEIDRVRFLVEGPAAWTLTAHQPAPEPEPEWEPGTVYSARYYMKADSEPMWFRDWKGAPRFVTATGEDFPPDEVEDVRPLVVIDPAAVDVEFIARHEDVDAEDVRRVVRHLGIEVSR